MALKTKHWRVALALLVMGSSLLFAVPAGAASKAPTITSFAPKTGPGGSSTSIFGTNFNGTTEVDFTTQKGPSPSTNFSVANSTHIKVDIPIAAITGPVTVKTPLGTATSSTNFIVQEPGRPYVSFKGDVFTGGWFDNGYESCQDEINNDPGYAALYQSPSAFNGTYQDPNSVNEGGILTYQNVNSDGTTTGSSADYGVWAMGMVSSNKSKFFGFSSDQAVAKQKNSQVLIFGNTGTNDPKNGGFYKPDNFGGGLLAGAEQKIHCIPDYFNTKQNNPQNWTGASDLSTAKSGQYIVNSVASFSGNVLNLNTHVTNIAAGKDITLFVNGDVYIGNNIAYVSHKINTVPHLALVVLGDIFVGPNVNHLDGLYIAQPNVDSNKNVTKGIFWSCHPLSESSYTSGQIYQNCKNNLAVSGGVIARQVNLLRINGSIDKPGVNPAETFSYPPESAVGGPFFNQTTSGNHIQIDSIVNLPPIF